MAKVKITGHASGTGVVTVTAPNTSTDRTITLPDSTDTLIGATTTDALTTRINGTGGRKNIIINGGMQVSQRGASFTGLTSSTFTLDRWQWSVNTGDTSTVSQSTDAPSGFGNSVKIEVTTADSSLDATDYAGIISTLEGQNLQSFGWGTASAEDVTISFWCKSSVTGTYASGIYSYGSSEWCTGTFTIDSANTWEYKTITIPAETTSSLPNSNGGGIEFYIRLAAGSSYSSGTPLTWGGSANLGAGISNNFITTTNATFYLTGVQLELGSVATDFEHRSYGEELALCQRYFERFDYDGGGVAGIAGQCHGANILYGALVYQPKRADPTVSTSTVSGSNFRVLHTGTVTNVASFAFNANRNCTRVGAFTGSGLTSGNAGIVDTGSSQGQYIDIDAEL